MQILVSCWFIKSIPQNQEDNTCLKNVYELSLIYYEVLFKKQVKNMRYKSSFLYKQQNEFQYLTYQTC